MRRQVVITRMDSPAYAAVADLLRYRDIDVFQAPWDENTLDLVQSTGFDVIIVGYPVEEQALRRFVKCARAPGSACRRCGMILVADDEHFESAQSFVGEGINRAIGTKDTPHLLATTVDELTSIAPRVTLRAPTRIVVRLEDRPVSAFCQTENVSTSGMLLRGFGHYPRGTTITFEINIPGESDPIRGSAEITRSTNVAVERLDGVGARFLSFSSADQTRLASYIGKQVN